MTSKTAPGMYNADHPSLLTALEVYTSWGDNAFVEGVISGTLTRRLNAAPTLELSVANPRGLNAEAYPIGSRVSFAMDYGRLSTTDWKYYGIITPNGGITRGQNRLTIRTAGITSELSRQHIHIGQYYDSADVLQDDNYDDWEAGALIRTVADGADGVYLDTDAVQSSSPAKYAGDIGLSAGWQTRLDVVNQLVDGMADVESDADNPRPYYWQETIASAARIAGIEVRKMPSLATASRTLTFGEDIYDGGDTLSSGQCVRCICRSSTDEKVSMTYENASLVSRFRYWDAVIERPTVNRDELLDAAFRHVQMHRFPTRSYSLSVPDALQIRPMQVVAVDAAPYGVSGNMMVTEVRIPFGIAPQAASISLAACPEMATDLL